MKCKLCKIRKATNYYKNLHICYNCLLDIQLGFRYFIGSKEVSYEEHKRAIDRGEV